MPRSYASAVFAATADEVWAYVRDFANIDEWLPGITSCELEDGRPADEVGVVRTLVGPGGGVFREELTALDDGARTFSYNFLESPLPVRGFAATLRVAPVTDSGHAFVEWSAEFEADPDDERAMVKTFDRAVFGPGLAGLRSRFS